MQPICQQKPVDFTVRCKKNTLKCCKIYSLSVILQYIVLCLFLQYIGLKNCKILQCTVNFTSIYYIFLQYNVNFTGVCLQIGCQLFYCKIYIFFTVYISYFQTQQAYMSTQQVKNSVKNQNEILKNIFFFQTGLSFHDSKLVLVNS